MSWYYIMIGHCYHSTAKNAYLGAIISWFLGAIISWYHDRYHLNAYHCHNIIMIIGADDSQINVCWLAGNRSCIAKKMMIWLNSPSGRLGMLPCFILIMIVQTSIKLMILLYIIYHLRYDLNIISFPRTIWNLWYEKVISPS